MSDTQTAPAGWYPDPLNPEGKRYWDGAAWGPEAPHRVRAANGAGVTSLVFGIAVAVITIFAYSELAIILALIGLAFGILGAARSRVLREAPRVPWIIGLVLNVAVIIIAGLGIAS